jgi:membrane protein DedA with SNARE-associated domain
METLVNFILENSSYAPWMVFVLILLAGLNIPISIDVIMVLTAFLAATLIPEHTMVLYLSILFGTYFSAMICYWVGRTIGIKLLKIRYFSKLLPKERLEKVGKFYEKYGLLTLLIGRFIPFGVRNRIFMTTGMSKANFRKFIVRDAIACSIWATVCFFGFHRLGQNYEMLLSKVKTLNLYIFIAFGVTVIILVCYKKYRKNQARLREKSELNP